MIHAITWAFVLTSGAGMSWLGPMNTCRRSTKVRVMFSRSRCDVDGERGSQSMPPLAPPYGTSTTAVFQVISDASARTSSRSTSGW